MPKGLIDAIGNNKVQTIYTVAVQQEKGSYLCYLNQDDVTYHCTVPFWQSLRLTYASTTKTRCRRVLILMSPGSAKALKKSCPSLVQWLETRVAKDCEKHLSVSFGPTDTTYAACAPCCNAVMWSNVPDQCKTFMESLCKVRHVALGAGNAYAVLYEGGIW